METCDGANNNNNNLLVPIEQRLRDCLDAEFADQCAEEIIVLAKVLERHVEHAKANNETTVRIEREKRLNLERQLKDAVNILDSVRSEIEDTKQKHLRVLARLKQKRTRLKNDKNRLGTELVNLNNEVARLRLIKRQADEIEQRVAFVRHNCKQKQHADHAQLKFVSEDVLGESNRSELEQELHLSRVVLLQHQANVETLTQSLVDHSSPNSTNKSITESHKHKQPEKQNQDCCQKTNEEDRNKLGNDSNIPDQHISTSLLNAIKTIHGRFSNKHNVLQTGSDNVSNDKPPIRREESLDQRIAYMFLQSEQKSLADLNNRMNKHVEKLTNLLSHVPQTQKLV